jgi:hypothetical protein
MQDIVGEILYFILAGGWPGVLAILLGIAAAILAVRGSRRNRPALVNWGFVFSIAAFVIGLVGMFGDMSKVDAYVKSQVEQGANAEVADGMRSLGNWESYDALFWGIAGLMPGLWVWLGRRGRMSTAGEGER